MRRIEFRGLRTDGKGWAYGYYFHHVDGEIDEPVIICPKGFETYIRSESVGQFTDLYDRNGVKVFEGDNVTINGKEYFIRFNMGVFVAESVTANHLSLLPWEFNGTDITVTGNLHEPATVRE